MKVELIEKLVPSASLTSWARYRINVFGGRILKRLVIRQHLDPVGANQRWIFFQGAYYGIVFLL